MIRRIRDLLYEQGFTISGARNKMQELAQSQKGLKKDALELSTEDNEGMEEFDEDTEAFSVNDQTTVMAMESAQRAAPLQASSSLPTLRRELMDIRDLLSN
jgi:hypothetical protein